MTTRLLIVPEVADTLRMSISSVYRWCLQGKLTPIRLRPNGKLLFRESDVAALVNNAVAQPACTDAPGRAIGSADGSEVGSAD